MSDLDKFNYECEDQIDIFDLIRKPISITKPIRLIELFAGYGSQAMALRDIGAKFEHYRVVEFDKYAITSYNAVHGTDFQTMLDCELPDDEQEIIVTDGRHVWVDTCIVNDGYALDSEHDWIEDVVAWMPLPEPYRESEEEQ